MTAQHGHDSPSEQGAIARPETTTRVRLIKGFMALVVLGGIVAALMPSPANYVPMHKVGEVHRAVVHCAIKSGSGLRFKRVNVDI